MIEAGCERAADVSPCIEAHRATVDSVILGGGDGTINAAAAGLMATGLPMGVLPLGTANDFVRSIGVPSGLEAAADIVLEGFARTVDVGDVNGHPFLNVASVGLAADLARKITGRQKRRFGRLSYAINAAELLARARVFHATLITAESKTLVRTLQIAVGNGRFYGGGNVVASEARIDDGTLDLYSLEFAKLWRMALMVPSFKSGAHGAISDVRTARGARFEILTLKPRPVNADGELVTQTPALFTVKPRAITVYVPRSS